jgi:hypothetical protein
MFKKGQSHLLLSCICYSLQLASISLLKALAGIVLNDVGAHPLTCTSGGSSHNFAGFIFLLMKQAQAGR